MSSCTSPLSAQRPVVIAVSLAVGLALALSFYYLCIELRLTSITALILTAAVILDPANILYGNWYFYSALTATLVTFGALCVARFVRTSSWVWGILLFASMMTIVLVNSTFQWFWLVLAAFPLVVVMRRHWRRLLVVAAIPLLIVSFWYAKNAVLFQTYSTSSWLGMNMARITVQRGTPQQIRHLLRHRTISPIVLSGTFMPLAYYGKEYENHKPTGIAVLDQATKSNGKPNLNDASYIPISNRFLDDDLAYVRAYPVSYLHEVMKSTTLFFVPSDQYGFLVGNSNHLTPYVHFYDTWVDWQPRNLGLAAHPLAEQTPAGAEMSVQALLVFAIAIAGVPILVWRRRRSGSFAVTLAFIWISTVYVSALSVLLDFSENQRFRYDLGPLPLAAAATVVAAAVAGVGRRRVHSELSN